MGSKGKEGAAGKVDKKSREVKKDGASNSEFASASNVPVDGTLEASFKPNKKEKKKKNMVIENEVERTNNYVEKCRDDERAKSLERKKKKKRKLELDKDDEGIKSKKKRVKAGKDVSNYDREASEVKEALNEKMCEGGEENEMLQTCSGKDVRIEDELKANKKKKKKRKESMYGDGLVNASSEEPRECTKEEISKKEQIARTRNLKEDDTKKKKGKKGKTEKELDILGEKSAQGDRGTMKKSVSVEDGSKKVPGVDVSEEIGDHSDKSEHKGKSKRVSFIDNVKVFGEDDEEDGLVRGKRFSQEEDDKVREAVLNYIEEHGLGEEGLKMIMNCKSYPEVKNCWKDIGAALPWRPSMSIYYRAHILFERGETRTWTAEDIEMIRKHHEKHGADWKKLAEELGKHRFHVKDFWRRNNLPNKKKGRWSQDEYQSLFDLVSTDLRMRAFGSVEKKSKHGMLRDNICWGAISDKLSTRTSPFCCVKWYRQLTSPMVAEGLWADTDDYRLLDALYNLDACCIEDVDWDNLLAHRDGDVCRKRWNQMVKYIDEYGSKSFAEQVEVLSKRYCPELLEARETFDSKPTVP